ncbi:MAG: glycosyltransferase family 9 protein [Nitrospirota bacterium]|nr:glycosyltransferase family 9 protein [Nitrospirota bacterium]MDH5586202.1 glycosyltransferase family 9 protein [Nitrospirota bacterium]MDH5773839.1 glycosyltransferase family 9 protein [Nitrospirota bacterium]
MMGINGRDMSSQGFPLSTDLPVRILILAIRAIGDVVLITPIISLLKKSYPKGYFAVLVDGPTAEVLANNPSIDRLIVIDRAESQRATIWKRGENWLGLVRDLRKEHFDVVLDVFSGPRSAILAYASGAVARYGEDFRNRGRGFLYNYPIKIRRDGRHLIEQKLDLVHALLGVNHPQVGGLEIHVTEREKQQGQVLLAKNNHEAIRRIGLIPSAGSKWRVWPSERFAELADVLIETYRAEVVLLGGADDRELCHAIVNRMRTPPLDLSGRTTLRELMAVLGELDLVIANVTGPMHLASALPKPKVIGLYGAADTIQYAPWGLNAMMLTKGTKEDAYWFHVDYEKDYEYLCQITVADVLKRVVLMVPDWVEG